MTLNGTRIEIDAREEDSWQHPLVSNIFWLTLVCSPAIGITVGVVTGMIINSTPTAETVVALKPAPLDLFLPAIFCGAIAGVLATIIVAAIGITISGFTEAMITLHRRRNKIAPNKATT